jgi:hypothetical protein
MPGPDGRIAADDILRLAVVYPDGRVATNINIRHRLPEADGGLMLYPEGGGGGGGSFGVRYWVHPLPPPGSVTLVCEWPRSGVPESRVDVPAQAILDASTRAVRLRPEPEPAHAPGQPDRAAGPRRPAAPTPRAWTSSSPRRTRR